MMELVGLVRRPLLIAPLWSSESVLDGVDTDEVNPRWSRQRLISYQLRLMKRVYRVFQVQGEGLPFSCSIAKMMPSGQDFKLRIITNVRHEYD